MGQRGIHVYSARDVSPSFTQALYDHCSKYTTRSAGLIAILADWITEGIQLTSQSFADIALNWKGAGKESAIIIALLNTRYPQTILRDWHGARHWILQTTISAKITRVAMKSAPRQGAEFAIEAAKILDGNEAQFQKLNHIR